MAIDTKTKRKSVATTMSRGHYQQPTGSAAIIKRMTQAHRYGGNGANAPTSLEGETGILGSRLVKGNSVT